MKGIKETLSVYNSGQRMVWTDRVEVLPSTLTFDNASSLSAYASEEEVSYGDDDANEDRLTDLETPEGITLAFPDNEEDWNDDDSTFSVALTPMSYNHEEDSIPDFYEYAAKVHNFTLEKQAAEARGEDVHRWKLPPLPHGTSVLYNNEDKTSFPLHRLPKEGLDAGGSFFGPWPPPEAALLNTAVTTPPRLDYSGYMPPSASLYTDALETPPSHNPTTHEKRKLPHHTNPVPPLFESHNYPLCHPTCTAHPSTALKNTSSSRQNNPTHMSIKNKTQNTTGGNMAQMTTSRVEHTPHRVHYPLEETPPSFLHSLVYYSTRGVLGDEAALNTPPHTHTVPYLPLYPSAAALPPNTAANRAYYYGSDGTTTAATDRLYPMKGPLPPFPMLLSADTPWESIQTSMPLSYFPDSLVNYRSLPASTAAVPYENERTHNVMYYIPYHSVNPPLFSKEFASPVVGPYNPYKVPHPHNEAEELPPPPYYSARMPIGPSNNALVPPQRSDTVLFLPSPKRGVVQPSPKMGVVQPSPKIGVVQPSPKMGVVQPSPKIGVVQPSPKIGVVPQQPSPPCGRPSRQSKEAVTGYPYNTTPHKAIPIAVTTTRVLYGPNRGIGKVQRPATPPNTHPAEAWGAIHDSMDLMAVGYTDSKAKQMHVNESSLQEHTISPTATYLCNRTEDYELTGAYPSQDDQTKRHMAQSNESAASDGTASSDTMNSNNAALFGSRQSSLGALPQEPSTIELYASKEPKILDKAVNHANAMDLVKPNASSVVSVSRNSDATSPKSNGKRLDDRPTMRGTVASAPSVHEGTPKLQSFEGSLSHPNGCKPCAFYWSKGCLNEANCKFCHEWHPTKKKKPMKDQKNLMIIARGDQKLEFLRCTYEEALAASDGRI